MRPFFPCQVLNETEIQKIHAGALSILARTGLRVEHDGLRDPLAAFGAQCDSAERVRFPEPLVERFLADSDRLDYATVTPRVGGGVGVSLGLYLDPETDTHVPWQEETLLGYIKLAGLLEYVGRVGIQVNPVGPPRVTQPLEARILAWKYNTGLGGCIQRTELCPYLLDMYGIMADATGKAATEIEVPHVYMVSPLVIPRAVAEQVLFFREHGIRVNISNMISAGGSGPVTLAGSIALNVAERIALGILGRALHGSRSWTLRCNISPLDMRTMSHPYGRPEQILANLAMAQLARHYEVPFNPHCGHSDAKRPSVEAGMQKIFSAWPCILTGRASIMAGRLAGDAVYSPIQMILDNELIGAVRGTLRGFEVNDDTLALDVIDRVGPGGFFTADEHTALNFRDAQWQPVIWSREAAQAWLNDGRKIDAEKALEIWHELMAQPDPEPRIDDKTEERLRAVVARAASAIGG
ncbi:MAG: trimethylamine methyltransferase family protein [Kiritimatiellae bacterium]|nr:trimethylamine methyltransferase family protein [Kiritimatiellia bacterium]